MKSINDTKFLNDNQQACVALLRDALDEAVDGKIYAVALVVCLDGGWANALAGNRPGDLNLGCDDVKAKILQAVTSDEIKNKKKASILRVS